MTIFSQNYEKCENSPHLLAYFYECLRKNGHENRVFLPENQQQKSLMSYRRSFDKKIIKITMFSFFWGEGYFEKNGEREGGGAMVVRKVFILGVFWPFSEIGV